MKWQYSRNKAAFVTHDCIDVALQWPELENSHSLVCKSMRNAHQYLGIFVGHTYQYPGMFVGHAHQYPGMCVRHAHQYPGTCVGYAHQFQFLWNLIIITSETSNQGLLGFTVC